MESYRIGAGLMALGLEKGERCALLSQGRNLWVIGELGILYAGGVNVPLSIKLEEASDLLFRIQHSDARYIFTSEQQLPKIRKILPECPNVEKVIVFDPITDLQEKEMLVSELQTMGDAYLKEHADAFKARYESVGPDDYANISYTSGTTADPKGILLTHRNYTANVEQAHSVIGIDEGDVMLIILPLDHCFAHVAGFYTMMSYGGSIATVPVGKNALASLKNIPMSIAEVRPHVMLSVPALARNFKKNIETTIKKKGPKVEALYNFALRLAISYNKEYWKVPVYLGLMGFGIHYYLDCNKNFERFRAIYKEATEPGYSGQVSADQALYYRNTYRRYRDYALLATAAVYLLQIIDANVFSYMHNFEVNDDLSMKLAPTVIVPQMQLASNSVFDNAALGLRVGLTF